MSSTSDYFEQSIFTLGNSKKPSKQLEKLALAGINKIIDLLWVMPLRIQPYPTLKSLENLVEGQVILASGKAISRKSNIAFGAKGKGRVQLFNMTLILRDHLSSEIITLKWFNIYPNQRKQLNEIEDLKFIGTVTVFNGQKSINNPKIINIEENESQEEFLIEYPTINSVPGKFIKTLFDKIKINELKQKEDFLPKELLTKNKLLPLDETFIYIHAKVEKKNWDQSKFEMAKKRLIYQEFLNDQIKINLRKKYLKSKEGQIFDFSKIDLKKIYSRFPFQLTEDQIKAIDDIKKDTQSGVAMMRMIQGDVGCGKTSVAIIASEIAVKNNFQAAIMCPTETLAKQHYNNFKNIITDAKIELLLGSHKTSEKNAIYKRLKNHEIDIIIGTHSLFQDKVEFEKLGFVVIDEQHKFGVEQRLKLLAKGKNPHCITMTATPIPRTLRLTQYGDLDISFIKQMPSNRKGIKTRIVTKSTFDKFLSFIKTRLEMNEQVYVVAPAIEESEQKDIKNVMEITEKFKQYFPNNNIEFLHGKLSSEEKDTAINNFRTKKIEILISTSVIEVGIDNPNATVMAIFGPERFGLSSLHQLRGRVGRGDKTGFCFLVSEEELSLEAMKRLSVLEKTTDGFLIAEEDLNFRGQGDLFGVNQSGLNDDKKVANIFQHKAIFEDVIRDINDFKLFSNNKFQTFAQSFELDDKITKTV